MPRWNFLIYLVWFGIALFGLTFLNFPDFFGFGGLTLIFAENISWAVDYILNNLGLGGIPILGDLIGHILKVPLGVETLYAFLVVLLLFKDLGDEVKIGFRLRPEKEPFFARFFEHLPVVLLIALFTLDPFTRFLALVDAVWDGFQDLRTRFR